MIEWLPNKLIKNAALTILAIFPFIVSPLHADTIFQAKVWVEQNATQVRVKTEIHNTAAGCQNAIDEYVKLLVGKGHKVYAKDTGTYKGYMHTVYLTKNGKNRSMLSCTGMP